jgi:hypothetical protein
LLLKLSGIDDLWFFCGPYGPQPAPYRHALAKVLEEVAYREFSKVSVGFYRRRQ